MSGANSTACPIAIFPSPCPWLDTAIIAGSASLGGLALIVIAWGLWYCRVCHKKEGKGARQPPGTSTKAPIDTVAIDMETDRARSGSPSRSAGGGGSGGDAGGGVGLPAPAAPPPPPPPAAPIAVPEDEAEIHEEHKRIKAKLRAYEIEYEREHGAKPRKRKEWGPVWDQYQQYQALRAPTRSASSSDSPAGSELSLSSPTLPLLDEEDMLMLLMPAELLSQAAYGADVELGAPDFRPAAAPDFSACP